MVFPHAIFFDLDGTLVEGGVTWRAAVSETVRVTAEARSEIHPDALEAAYYEAAKEAWESVKTPAPPAWGSMETESVVRDVWATALERAGATGGDIVARAVTTYCASLQRLGAPAYDDVAECLCRLRNRCRLGVITNGNAAIQQAKIDRAGLGQYFESVTTSDVGAGKPDRRIFEYAARAMEVELGASVYVGDLLEWDVGGANGAGMVSVWLNRRGTARKGSDPVPDAVIASLAELPDLVGRMEAKDARMP